VNKVANFYRNSIFFINKNGHFGWRMFWSLVCTKRKHVQDLLHASSKDAKNRGRPFSFEDFKVLMTKEWSADLDADFPTFLVKSFMTKTMLLGALRTEQQERFRKGGLASLKFKRENIDSRGYRTPLVTSCYKRVKPRTGTTPHNADEDFFLTIICTCEKDHLPINISHCE
jgi:hypothetical protein